MVSAATSEFDRLFADIDPQIDALFGKGFVYRRQGQSIPIAATLTTHKIEADEKNGLSESWHGHIFEVASDALVFDGDTFLPASGDEIAEPLADGGFEVYVVRPKPKGRCYDPLDAEQRKLLVYCLYIRTESA